MPYSVFEEFSADQIEEVSDQFPAARRYIKLLQSSSLSNFKLKRHHEWLRVVCHSYFGTEDQKSLLNRWSLFFDSQIEEFWKKNAPDDLAILALGKLGSFELNLSSDIDVIFVGENNDESSRFVRSFIAAFDAQDEFGFFTRVDLEIRPGGKHSPLIQTKDQIENYYFYHGETWERLALIRLRSLQAPGATKKAIAKLRKKFCFRKYIDYASIDDFARLRTSIHRQAKSKQRDGLTNIKLFPGGIRDIELFCHSLCVLHGGRSPSLDLIRTGDQIRELSALNIISKEQTEFLLKHYWNLRRIENLIQAKEDRQTHSIAKEDSILKHVLDDENLMSLMEQCKLLIDDYVQIKNTQTNKLPDDLADQIHLLTDMGFDHKFALRAWPKVIERNVRSRFSERDEAVRKEVLFSFLQSISKNSKNKNLALELLGDFIKATRAKAGLYRFFQAHPEVIDEISTLFGMSSYLSGILCRRPELVDNFVFRAQATPPVELESLLEYLADHKQLGQILYSLDFSRDQNLEVLCGRLSQVADYIARALLSKISGDSKLNILKLGKWGGAELGLRSDLDFVFVYAGSSIPEELHKKVRKYISLMGAKYRAGSLYSIDLRLRPSGNSGPLLVTEQKLKDYLTRRLKAWEKQAYLKASFLNPSNFPLAEIKRGFCFAKEDEIELSKIRKKLVKQLTPNSKKLDIKYVEGGIANIELVAQEYVIKRNVEYSKTSNRSFIDALSKIDNNWTTIGETYSKLRYLEQSLIMARGISSTIITSDDQLSLAFSPPGSLAFEELKHILGASKLLLDQISV